MQIRWIAVFTAVCLVAVCSSESSVTNHTRDTISASIGVEGSDGRRAFISVPTKDPNVPEGELDFDWSFCNKKIRIVFYMKPPFTIVNPEKCEPDPNDKTAASFCPPEAFGVKPSEGNKEPDFEENNELPSGGGIFQAFL